MQIITHWKNAPPNCRGASAALGNFDGLHRGHQAVIDAARRPGLPLGVITFEPHPREFFAPEAPPFRLMNAESRRNRLERLGVDCLFQLSFNTELSSLTPEEFARDVLAEGLGLGHVVVGADFCFGRQRAGSAGMLRDLGVRYGFEVTILPILGDDAGEISSTAIRQALSEGKPEQAAQMLGHRHRIDGKVQHGAKRGRELGYPTANMALDRLHLPRFGVYAVKVQVLAGEHAGEYDGVASLGVRPMFGQNKPNLEAHLFDFNEDIYGIPLSVALVGYLRGEEKFDSLEALIAQMDIDSARARSILAEV